MVVVVSALTSQNQRLFSVLEQKVFILLERETRLSACTVAVPRCRTKSYSSSFFPRTASLCNSLPGACFPSSYDLPSFKRNINSYLQLHWVSAFLCFLPCSPLPRVAFSIVLGALAYINKINKKIWIIWWSLSILVVSQLKAFQKSLSKTISSQSIHEWTVYSISSPSLTFQKTELA